MTLSFFFFNDTATTEIYTLSLHDALPILIGNASDRGPGRVEYRIHVLGHRAPPLLVGHVAHRRSEEHTSELQSQSNLVCRLLLEKKKKLPDRLSASRAPVHVFVILNFRDT